MQEKKKLKPQKLTYISAAGNKTQIEWGEGRILPPVLQQAFSGLKKWHNTPSDFDASSLPPLIIQKIATKNGVDVGHGVFAEEEIKTGTWVFLYTGEILNSDIMTDAQSQSPYLVKVKEDDNGVETGVDSQYVGGVGRFANHFPTRKELEQFYKFKDEFDIDQVATANIEVKGQLGESVINVFVALRDIAKGEQLGHAYGAAYYMQETRQQNEIFNKEGEIIDRSSYTFRERVLFLHATNLGSKFVLTRSIPDFLYSLMHDVVQSEVDFEEYSTVYSAIKEDGIDAAGQVLDLLKKAYDQSKQDTFELESEEGEGILTFEVENVCTVLTAQLKINSQFLHLNTHLALTPEAVQKYKKYKSVQVQEAEIQRPLPSAAAIGKSMQAIFSDDAAASPQLLEEKSFTR